MNRRRALLGGAGLLGGGILVGGSLYGSSDIHVEPTEDDTVVRRDGDRIDSLHHPLTPVTDDNGLVGVSLPDRTAVQTVEVGVIWAIRKNGLWSNVTLELVVTGDVRAEFNPGVPTGYRSPWTGSPSEAGDSTPSHRRYVYPIGSTAGRVDSLLTVLDPPDSGETVIDLEAHLSADSLGGPQVELSAPAELIYSPE